MPFKLKPLAEQTIVITGGSSGIGLATARRAARAGAQVVLAARNEEALAEAVAGIERAGGQAAWCAVDMADEDAPQQIGEVANARFGGFDTWVNDAAAAIYSHLTEVDTAEHKRVFDVGYFGTVRGSLYALEHLKDKGGALINIGSVLSDIAIPIQGPYCAMKHAVKSFTQSLRIEHESDGGKVAISLIKPNGINTPYPEHARNKMGVPATIPPLVYDVELVARAICFCAEHQRRELTVGGQGLLLTTLGALFPQVSERAQEAAPTEQLQQIDTPPEPGAADNLFEPRADGRERTNQPIFVRKTSLALEMQLHPLTTATLALGGVIAGAAAITLNSAARRARSVR